MWIHNLLNYPSWIFHCQTMQSPGYPSARKQITYRMEIKTLQNFIHALHYSEKSLYSHQKRLGKSSNFGRPSFKRSTNFLLRRFRMNPLLLIQVGRHLSHLRHKRWIMEHEAPARGSSHATWPIYERQGTIANMLWQKLCLHWCSILRYPSLSVLLEVLYLLEWSFLKVVSEILQLGWRIRTPRISH